MKSRAKVNAKKGRRQGKEFWEKKLHACKVQLKRSVKKAKEFEIRKIVRSLKKAKETSKSADEITHLETRLNDTKDVNIDELAQTLSGGEGTEGSIDPKFLKIVNSTLVQEKLKEVEIMRHKIEELELPLESAIDEKRENSEASEEEITGEDDGEVFQGNEESEFGIDTTIKSFKKNKEKGGSREQKPPKKKKNRLGQRARKRLAGIVPKGTKRDESKRKMQRSTIVSFENVKEQLHPSWAAKKEIADAIKKSLNSAGASKKIVFDE